MHVLVIDRDPASRAALFGRLQLASKQAEIRRVDFIPLDANEIATYDPELAHACLIGPGCYEVLDKVVERVRGSLPNCLLAVVLENETYANEAVLLRKNFNLRVMPLGDLAQLASFLIDAENQLQAKGESTGKGVIAVTQLKGGVGATTVCAALAACYARHGLSVAIVDLDDVNPQLTDWGRVGVAQRTVTSEFLRQGDVPQKRINELVSPVEGFGGRLVVVGQPERYNEGFHFKADVLDGAPSSSDYINALINTLKREFEIVLFDTGMSWGVAAFSTFPLCQEILLVTDDDGMSVRRTLDNLERLRRESDDPEEFDLSRWSLVLNAYSGKLIKPQDLANEIQSMEILPPESNLYTIPFSDSGRQWGAPGQTLYDLADDSVKFVITKIAATMVPFRFEESADLMGKIAKKWKTLIG